MVTNRIGCITVPKPPNDPSPTPPSQWFTIPYVNNISESIRRILKDLNITTRFRPHQTLRNILVSAKDHALPETRTGVVYSIPVVTVQQHMLAKLKDLSHIV